MVRRHPHVFGDVKVGSSGEVLKNWAEIKAAEGKTKIFDIPAGMPALLRAHKIGEKTKKLAFDWDGPEQCWAKVEEELGELTAASLPDEIEDEFGDVLFSLVQWARHNKIDSEQALRKTNMRFEKRFERMQELVKADDLEWSRLSADLKEKYWKRAKA
jgi:MazG family protein